MGGQQTAASSSVYKRQSINLVLDTSGKCHLFSNHLLVGNLGSLGCSACRFAEREQLFVCLVKLLSVWGGGQKGDGSPLFACYSCVFYRFPQAIHGNFLAARTGSAA